MVESIARFADFFDYSTDNLRKVIASKDYTNAHTLTPILIQCNAMRSQRVSFRTFFRCPFRLHTVFRTPLIYTYNRIKMCMMAPWSDKQRSFATKLFNIRSFRFVSFACKTLLPTCVIYYFIMLEHCRRILSRMFTLAATLFTDGHTPLSMHTDL